MVCRIAVTSILLQVLLRVLRVASAVVVSVTLPIFDLIAVDDRLIAEHHADVAELVDALDLGSSAERRGGSSPSIRTKYLYVT